MSNRRTFLGRAFAAGAALFAARELPAQTMQMQMPMPPAADKPPSPKPDSGLHAPLQTEATPFLPVVTTDVGDLDYSMEGTTKVFHLVAEVLRQKIHPDKTIDSTAARPAQRSRSTRATMSASSSTTICLRPAPFIGTASKT
jgi:manganese oxidase